VSKRFVLPIAPLSIATTNSEASDQPTPITH
jgi:hypothetical protein